MAISPDDFEMIDRAVRNGWPSEDILAAVQEVTIVARAVAPGETVTNPEATRRLLHLACVGMLFEKGYYERKQ